MYSMKKNKNIRNKERVFFQKTALESRNIEALENIIQVNSIVFIFPLIRYLKFLATRKTN